ncbi:hypothetical protein L484_004788 [Morus notabilis]|uniref:Uncharacterized protein n=1 Tax=Morus notabilis TaxID=981085 RepID=W9R4I2_9ROSA|nr:histone acetyltransferase KAT6B [Morus notabilis]EXB37998.1 hypothetical protein L484_004788 [Morus notabilis]
MMVSLGPGKFYGTSLPRPRFYTDVKFNDERVDPPTPVLDPLLSWANEAHWSMGGLSFKRLRFQGRIEGSVSKLRAEREKLERKRKKEGKQTAGSSSNGSDLVGSERKMVDSDEDSPPPAPIATKRRRFMDLIDEDEEDDAEEEEEEEKIRSLRVRRRRLVKKLGDDFDRVAPENEKADRSPSKSLGNGSRTRRRILEDNEAIETVMNVVEEVNKMNSMGKKSKGSGNKGKAAGGSESPPARVRTSLRLAKRH